MISPTLLPRYDQLRSMLEGAGTVVLTTHVNPDGDGLGSQVALMEYIAARGARPVVLNHDAVPAPYAFLDPDHLHLRTFDPEHDAATVRDARLILIVDTNHSDRLGRLAEHVRASRAPKIVIDHHLEPDPSAALVVSDDGACATGEVIYRFLEHAGAFPLSFRTATALYAAIMTDTGSFRFPKTDASVHRIAAHLLESGADPVAIYGSIYEQGRVNRIQLLGGVLSTLKLHNDGSIGTMYVSKEMFERTGSSEKDTDTFVTYPLTIAGVRVSIMVSELPGLVKLNVRSKGTIPANEIAKAFGGNGHRNAAGARLSSSPIDRILAEAVAVAVTKIPEGTMK